MQHRDDPSAISGKTLMESICVEGAPKITVDIYNNWYRTKEQEDIRITPYAAFYTGDSISIDSNNKEFVIDGLNMQGSPIAMDAICYSTGAELHRDFKIRTHRHLSSNIILVLEKLLCPLMLEMFQNGTRVQNKVK